MSDVLTESLSQPFVPKAKLAPTNKIFKSYSQLSAERHVAYIVNYAYNGTLGDCIGNRLEVKYKLKNNYCY